MSVQYPKCEYGSYCEFDQILNGAYILVEISLFYIPPWGRRGFKPRIRPPYPQRVVKGD